MATLVFLEHHDGELQKGSLGVLGKAAELGGGDVAAVVVGSGVKEAAATAGKFGATACSWPTILRSRRRCRSPASTPSRSWWASTASTPWPSQPRCCRRTSPRGWRRASMPA